MSVSDSWLRDGDGACTLASELHLAFYRLSLASHGSKVVFTRGIPHGGRRVNMLSWYKK